MIPNFDHNHVLPPHLGDPTASALISPYSTTMMEVVTRFALSKERIKILNGLLDYRARLQNLGILGGHQWLAGSFVQNIEALENRPPKDLEIVSFLGKITEQKRRQIADSFPEIIENEVIAKTYGLDSYLVILSDAGENIAKQTHYYSQLFTHTRTNIWKGMLRLELGTIEEDEAARIFLETRAD